MSPTKRLRIFAGPNGSGKSTFINATQANPKKVGFKLGYYVNADELEKELNENKFLEVEPFGIVITAKEIQTYFKKSTFAPVRLKKPDLWKMFDVSENRIVIGKRRKINSYIAADIAEFLRQRILKAGHSFSYETVMSDEKKLQFLRVAKKKGYRIYLYYFATKDPEININRVKVRVFQKGHRVKSGVIKKRYYKSLRNLRGAIKLSSRAYLFDNSKKESYLFMEISDGKNVEFFEDIPAWFWKYVVEK